MSWAVHCNHQSPNNTTYNITMTHCCHSCIYRYQSGISGFFDNAVDSMLATREASAAAAGNAPPPKRHRPNATTVEEDVEVDVDASNRAPPVVEQLAHTIIPICNSVSGYMKAFMESMGFTKEQMSPFIDPLVSYKSVQYQPCFCVSQSH